MSWFFWWGSLIFLFVLWGVLTLVLFFVEEKGFAGTLVCFVLAICSAVVLASTIIYWKDREVNNIDIFPWLFLVTALCAVPFIAVVEPFG